MPRTALFVIDIQNELAGNPQTQVPGTDKLRAAAEKILAASRSLADAAGEGQERALTVFVQHEEDPTSGGSLVRGAEPWKLVFPPRDGVMDEILVSKTTRTFLSLCLSLSSPPHVLYEQVCRKVKEKKRRLTSA